MDEKFPPQLPEELSKLLKPYDPAATEDRIYKSWEDSGFFNPDICIEKGITKADATPFSIVLPPPNVTGVLHMGHALMLTLQDIMVRYNRMKGKRTLWIPGTDHAAIATQVKVEKLLEKEGVRKNDLGREAFLQRVDQFAQESHDTIVNQVRKLGASVDWSREAFTLDEKRNLAVRTAFKKMYDDGLIYRGYRIVNWDPKGQTTVSDDEVNHEERKATLYTFTYSADFPIAISTTRPETKVGDTAVAVHPEDERYQEYIGKEYDIDFAGAKLHIKIVADESVEKEFGTGALGVTPAHSQIDWEIAQRHDLPVVPVINEYAKMTVGNESIIGKKTSEARLAVVEWLKENNLLQKEEEITQNVSVAERTGAVIEPLPKTQWFVNVNKTFTLADSKIAGIPSGSETTLKDIMRAAVENNQVDILPDNFKKIYFHWIDNLRDWCISRQIWYGHRIPVWYRNDEVYCDIEAPAGEGWTQDEDTLDTWFSSGLWTFSTLGWPEITDDLRTYHPTTVIQPGYEILFFWVARMILMSGYHLGEVPFQLVYLNGTVRDNQGRKLSKSLGNGRDPIEMAEEFGADAIRFFFTIATTPGNDSRIHEDKIKGYNHFSNKLWNITRFVLTATENKTLEKPTLTSEDQKLIEEFTTLHADVTKEMDAYHFHLAGEKLYHYLWDRFAAEIIEESKEILKDETTSASRQWTLLYILKNSIKTLHPFIPFVTEELWSLLHTDSNTNLLIVEPWEL